MATPHKSIFVNDDEKPMFDVSAGLVQEALGMNFSELIRQVIMNSETLEKKDLAFYMSREARKEGEYKYLVLKVKV